MSYICWHHFIHTVTILHVTALKRTSSGSTHIFREQVQQNTCLEVNIRLKYSELYFTWHLSKYNSINWFIFLFEMKSVIWVRDRNFEEFRKILNNTLPCPELDMAIKSINAHTHTYTHTHTHTYIYITSVHLFINLRNINFVTYFPENDHKSGRNM